jgi:very-short-patch-repair endonuclease
MGTTNLLRDESGRMYQAGIADSQPISAKKQSIMRRVTNSRLNLSTPAEKKLCFAFQVMGGTLGNCCRYQREKTVHFADVISRSLDFYFSECRLAVEADGHSHANEMQRAKDEWTDRMLLDKGVMVMRFGNAQILGNIHQVIHELAAQLLARHRWPRKLRDRFDLLMWQSESADRWQATCIRFLDARHQSRG